MRSSGHDPLAHAVGRLRAGASRARGRLAGLGPAGRVGLAVAALAVVLGVAYVAVPDDTADAVWLYDGHAYSAVDAAKVVQLLAARQIAADTDRGRVRVARSQQATALTVVAEAGLAPQSVRDLLDHPPSRPFLAPPDEVEDLKRRREERIYERYVAEIEGVPADPIVTLTRHRKRGLSAEPEVHVSVMLAADGDRPISPETVRSIQNVLTGMVTGLEVRNLTVLDSNGHKLDDPTLAAQLDARGREEELRDAIHERLTWIDGVRVSVRIDTPADDAPPPALAPTPPVSEPPADALLVENDDGTGWIGVNRPLGAIDPPAQPRAATLARAPGPPGKADVLVQVPVSYYRGYLRSIRAERTPSERDLAEFQAKIRASIRLAVEQAIPPAERGGLTVDNILDEPARPDEPVVVGTSPGIVPGSWRSRGMLLGAILSAAALGAAATAAGGRWWASRRREPRPVPTATLPRRVRVDVADGPAGPSDRVRELIRLDPDAAAGVLQRWIGAGMGDDRP